MATESIRIPQLGEGLREAYLVDFLKGPGDSVMRDEPLYTMETDKAISDVESPFAGTLIKWLVDTDSVLEIGTEIAIIETVCATPKSHSVPQRQQTAASAPSEQLTAAAATTGGGAERQHHANSADVAADFSIAPQESHHVSDQENVCSNLVKSSTSEATSTALIPPKTKRYLRDHQLMDVVGRISTQGRKMSIADVDFYLNSNAVTGAETASPQPNQSPEFEIVPLAKSQIRLNYRLVQAASTCVPVTLVNQWNWQNIENARNVTRPVGGPTAFSMACRCIAKAAKRHTRFRSSLTGDGKSYRVFHSVNLGIAVSLDEDQLVTAVVRDADQLSMEDFFAAYSKGIELARKGVDQADESTTLMVSNIGNIGMTIGIPAIVAPAVATVAIGQAVDKPVRDGDSFRFERSVTATMAFDHRIVNGIGAAAFLNDVREAVETFEL